MSIAVSAIIAPSRLLRAAVAGCAAVHLGAGLFLLCQRPAGVAAPAAIGLCLLAGGACLLAAGGARKTRRIDISGLGEIRLTVQGKRGAAPGPPLALLPASTLWPQLMLLRLRQPGGGVTVLTLLPDSLAAASFRPLAAALRHIAERNKKFLKFNQIY